MNSVRFTGTLLFCLLAVINCFTPLVQPSARNSRTVAWASNGIVTMGPSVLEREKVQTVGPAVLDRPEVQRKERADEPTKQRKGMGSEAWEVRIYNDGLNTREHVARSLVQVTGMTEVVAYQTMMQAHQNGIAVVGRWVYEVAEMYHEALRKNGIVCDIVPVEEDS